MNNNFDLVVIYRRMEKLVEADFGEDQFGFRRNVGTRGYTHPVTYLRR